MFDRNVAFYSMFSRMLHVISTTTYRVRTILYVLHNSDVYYVTVSCCLFFFFFCGYNILVIHISCRFIVKSQVYNIGIFIRINLILESTEFKFDLLNLKIHEYKMEQ